MSHLEDGFHIGTGFEAFPFTSSLLSAGALPSSQLRVPAPPALGAGDPQAWRGDPLSPLPAAGRRPALCGAGCSFPCLGSCPVGGVCGPQARNVSSAGPGCDEAARWPLDVSSLWAGAWKGLEVLHVGWVGGSLWHEVVLCFFCEASWFKEMLE